MNDRDYQTKTAIRGLSGVEGPETSIREAGPIGKANETIGYLNELEQLHGELRRKLYGPYPEPKGTAEKRVDEPSLEEKLHTICQRVACLVGDAKSLLSRLD